MDADRLARFWSNVDKNGPVQSHCPEIGNCWKWRNVNKWYGHFSPEKGKRLYAHRFSWELHNGPIPSGLCVLHKCDNPECVRPDHLFLGTHKDNADDKYAKGRGNNPSGDAHPFRRRPELLVKMSERCKRLGTVRNIGQPRRGSLHPQSKLSDKDIVTICNLRESGVGPQDIANQLGVSRSLIQQILRGDHWGHVSRSKVQMRKPAPAITPEIIDAIRQSDRPYSEIAKWLGISTASVCRVKLGRGRFAISA